MQIQYRNPKSHDFNIRALEMQQKNYTVQDLMKRIIKGTLLKNLWLCQITEVAYPSLVCNLCQVKWLAFLFAKSCTYDTLDKCISVDIKHSLHKMLFFFDKLILCSLCISLSHFISIRLYKGWSCDGGALWFLFFHNVCATAGA